MRGRCYNPLVMTGERLSGSGGGQPVVDKTDVKSLASEIISQIAPKLGLKVNIEPQFRWVGQIITPDGRKFYFRNTNFDLNSLGAAEMAKDKDYAAYFMRLEGYPVPEGKTFYSDEWCKIIGSDRDIHAAYGYARGLGFPVIVKPNSKSQGLGVSKVCNRREFYQAMRGVFNRAKDRVALVQEVIEGDDYRIVVLDEEVISAYQRLPLSVVGEGQSSILELLNKKQEEFIGHGRDTRIRFDDPRMVVKLRRMKLWWDSIPKKGEKMALLDNANLSTGGEAVDVTEIIHPDYRKLSIQLVKDMGLRYCGVDLITQDPIKKPPHHYTIVEINAAPGVDHYAQIGKEQRKLVERMYEKILLAIIKKKD